jgi:hypothetical protein
MSWMHHPSSAISECLNMMSNYYPQVKRHCHSSVFFYYLLLSQGITLDETKGKYTTIHEHAFNQQALKTKYSCDNLTTLALTGLEVELMRTSP